MKKILSIAIVALLTAAIGCSSEKEERIPLLAQLQMGKIYIPWFQAVPQNPPKDILFYPIYLKGDNPDPAASPVEAVFKEGRTDISAKDFSTAHNFLTTTGLIYSPKTDTPVEYERGFVLPAGTILKLDKANLEYRSADRTKAYRVVAVTSGEGIHYVIQSLQNGKCATSVRYYLYAGYDTEPSPEGEFERANCGRVISPMDLTTW